jgi:thiol-disulfide isomerase/thioredoxin
MVPTDELEDYPRKSNVKRLLFGIVALAVVGMVAFLALQPAEAPEGPPQFDLPLIDGGRLTSDDLEGSPVVLNFFASWCAPCREEAPLLERTYLKYKDRGVLFVGVNIKDTKAKARRFVRSYDVTYPVVFDVDQKLAKELDVFGLPQTFFVNDRYELSSTSSGRAIGEQDGTTKLGAISRRDLERGIRRLLDEDGT